MFEPLTEGKISKAVSGTYLSMEECQRLLFVVSLADHLALRILIELGLRAEELFALRRDDVIGGTRRIDEAIVEGSSGGVKTTRPETAVYVPPDLRMECKRLTNPGRADASR